MRRRSISSKYQTARALHPTRIRHCKPTRTSAFIERARCQVRRSELLGLILLVNTSTANAIGALLLVQRQTFFLGRSTVQLLLKDWVLVDSLEFGLEGAESMAMGAAV